MSDSSDSKRSLRALVLRVLDIFGPLCVLGAVLIAKTGDFLLPTAMALFGVLVAVGFMARLRRSKRWLIAASISAVVLLDMALTPPTIHFKERARMRSETEARP